LTIALQRVGRLPHFGPNYFEYLAKLDEIDVSTIA